MATTTSPKQKKPSTKKNKLPKEINILQSPDGSIICGWKSVEDCASQVWGGIHSSLLSGSLIFGLSTPSRDLKQLILVRNNLPKYLEIYGPETYGLGVMKGGWTGLSPVLSRNEAIDYISGYLSEETGLEDEVKEAWKTIIDKLNSIEIQ